MGGRTWGVWAALLVIVALLAAACGDDEGAEEVADEGLGTEEFLAEADAICAEHREAIETAASQALAGGQMPSPEEFGRLANETIIPELEAQFNELGELEAPEELAADFEAFVTEGEQTVAELRENPALITDAANFEELNAQADELGLSDVCDVGPGA